MRHKLAYRKLNRTSEHRKALFQNMLNSLIKYEQIITTLPKAKELKPKIDKVITLGKKSGLNPKKDLFSKLQDKSSVKKVFENLSKRYANRKGGYSRVLKAGFRTGDDAPMAVIELVDRDINAIKVDKPKGSYDHFYIELTSYSENLYNFNLTRREQRRDSDNFLFNSEAIFIDSNIEGGYGVFGGRARVRNAYIPTYYPMGGWVEY